MTSLTPKMQQAAVVQAMKDEGASLDDVAKKHPELAEGIALERDAAASRPKASRGSGSLSTVTRRPLVIS